MHPHYRSHLRLSSVAVLLSITGSLLLAACATQASVPPPKTAVSVQLSWTHEYSSAGFYAAQKNGHYAADGLEVRIDAGGFGPNGYIEPMDEVLDGSVDFGIGSASSLIEARSQGKPLVGIASIFQRNPTAILSLPDSGIKRPQDLVGRSVMVADGGAVQLLDSLFEAQGIDKASVTIIERTTYGIEPLLNKEVDALVGWIINEGVLMREANIEPNVILISDYGIDTYPMVLFATEQLLSQKPDVVQRFVDATIKGIQDVVANPDQSAGLALEYDKTLVLEGQQRRLQAALPLISPAGRTIGTMEPAIWEMTEQMLIDNEVIATPVDLSKTYTMQFLETSGG